ncbi:MAG: DNA repair protein RecN [Cyclobacteriaceae bacterium]
MIKSLSIKNYALIKELEMTPSPHLNIVTGETGAGKSIMLGAAGLLLGNRADTKSLLEDDSKCLIEGIFDVRSYGIELFFQDNELDYDEECIVRREIVPSGKSRAFINDTPVTLDVMKALGERLMDVHSQHESLHLANNVYQQEILDLFSNNKALLANYKSLYSSYKKEQKVLDELTAQAQKSVADQDYKQFLFNELEEANLEAEEQDSLEKELQVLEHAEEIKSNLNQLAALLESSDYAVFNQLKEGLALLSSVRNYSKPLEDFYDRLSSASIELKDLTDEIAREEDKVSFDPQRIQIVKDRIDLIYRLEQKHRVGSVQELIQIRNEIDSQLESFSNIDGAIEKSKASLDKLEKQLLRTGEKLSASRTKNAVKFSKEIEGIIHKLGIENGKVNFQLSKTDPQPNGLDKVEMLFSANKGVLPKELKQVTSGGEFSRLIFAVKYLIADKTAMPTIIFDEIDTGVSGEVALQMIGMMKEMSKNHQVIAISHLPQFAAGGDAHYFVYKDHSEDKSISKIKRLKEEERIMEIAKMIGGNEPGDHALVSAKELLSSSI